jgi:hypothetical protein
MPLEELGASEFDTIFAISGCTAKYEEQLFYLPYALEYLIVHPSEGEDYLADLVYFMSVNSNSLRNDGVLEAIHASIAIIFKFWTKAFDVVHFDLAACRAKGYRLDHSDYVENSQEVREMIDCLLRYQPNSQLAENLVSTWMRPNRTDTESAWLLEFAKEERRGYDYYSRTYPGKEWENIPTKFVPLIFEAVTDTRNLQRALDQIRTTIIKNEKSPTYWPDLIAALGLAA